MVILPYSEVVFMVYRNADMMRIIILKAIAHETRLKIVKILATQGKKCVCELVDLLGFDQSTISKHLNILKNAGIVKSNKVGLKVIYSVTEPRIVELIGLIDKITK